MAKRKARPPRKENRPETPGATHFFNLLAKQNRGLLLDIVVFVTNLFLMRLLARRFLELFELASADDQLAQFGLSLAAVAMWILPPTGAVLKRWHYHQRLKGREPYGALAGCLFNPIFFFCLNLVLVSAIIAALGTQLLGNAMADNGAIFVSTILCGLVLTIIQTYLIYQYFRPPKKPPHWKFLMRPESDVLGDACLFLNMILFQIGWNLLTLGSLGRPSDLTEIIGRFFALCFIALLIYFPPRMFYLAEDINRPRTWVTMLLANSPVIFRVLVGTSSNTTNW
jgi:hypothetical protein